MAKPKKSKPERRRSYRVDVSGVGLLWRHGRVVGQYALRDLSSGGCLLEHGPACEPGKEYRAVLRVGEGGSLRQRASIVHQSIDPSGRWTLGVQFLDESADVDARIEQMLLGDACRQAGARSGRVLVAHNDEARRGELRALLDRLGYTAVVAGTFSDAVWELENGPMDFHTALVSHDLEDTQGENVLKYICANYPEIRRVLVEDCEPTRELTPSTRSRYVDLIVPDAQGRSLLHVFDRSAVLA